ncbi:MAG TPA: proliferating cell nuclear antigen (pcna) [Candidatus Aenigmarchaeota archaeon]|nr:MAG: proliferating cell nuclear antigen (pcna) [Candidatus Aenigmarchaeota archaeon]HDD46007.1 proliferating cell nuclear antigen (pcna) [Candidatus Aenigmarchaeota archaeon]
MFEITLSNVDLLKNTIPIIAEIIDEGVFKVDKNGLSMISPDRSMIAVVDFKLLPTAFDEFKSEGSDEVGLNLSNFVSIIKRLRSGDSVTLKFDGNEFEIISKGAWKRKFTLPILDISMEKPPIEQLEFSGKVVMASGILEDGIADALIIDDSVVFEASNEYFKLWAKSELSATELQLVKGDEGLYEINVKDSIKARYPLEYLKKMIKASKLSDKVELEFGTDYPLRLTFKEIDKVHMGFILAPREE